MKINIENYKYIEPTSGILAIVEYKEEEKVLVRAGIEDSKAIGIVVSLPDDDSITGLQLGEYIVYDEGEGQELNKSDLIHEEYIILLRIEHVLAKLDIKEEEEKKAGKGSGKEKK